MQEGIGADEGFMLLKLRVSYTAITYTAIYALDRFQRLQEFCVWAVHLHVNWNCIWLTLLRCYDWYLWITRFFESHVAFSICHTLETLVRLITNLSTVITPINAAKIEQRSMAFIQAHVPPPSPLSLVRFLGDGILQPHDILFRMVVVVFWLC